MIPARIEGKVRIEDGTKCWLWTGAMSKKHPHIRHKGSGISARRFVYELVKGPIAPDLYCFCCCVDRRCVNPAHTGIGTKSQYMQAAMERGERYTSAASRAKITLYRRSLSPVKTPERARAIRMAEGTYTEIGERFGVSRSVVGKIKRGQSWVEPGLASMFQQMRRAA